MSGGSFDYLCHKDAIELGGQRHNLERMAEELAALEKSGAALMATLRIIDKLQELEAALTPELQEVWRAIEWWHSCDSSKEQAQDAVYKFRGKVLR